MTRNLFDASSTNRLIERVSRLQPDANPQWGSMTVTEMLLHCNKVNAVLLTPAKPANKKTSAKQYLFRWIVLYLLPRYPRGAQAPKQMLTKGTIDAAAFKEQQQAFVQLMQQLGAHKQPVLHRHPYFGNLSTRQWGLSAWKHVDHHLRQFGV